MIRRHVTEIMDGKVTVDAAWFFSAPFSFDTPSGEGSGEIAEEDPAMPDSA